MSPSIEVAEFVTIEALPIAETGVDYPASTGDFSITREMIQSAIEYTNDDPHGLAPRIKIGHADNPIDGDLQALFEQYNAERQDESVPTLGTIVNLATINDGHTIVGDWYGLPEWLAEIMKSAYPARSLEGGTWTNPANNKNYEFKIDAVALLGVVGPGCTSLADVAELFSKEGPKVTVIEMAAPKKKGAKLSVPAVNLQVNVEDLRRQFYGEFAQGDRYWWWDRELLADPWEFIASDENGDLWRIPFDPTEDDDGDTSVASWGDPEPIKVSYVPDNKRVADGVEAAVGLIAPRLNGAGTLLAVNSTKPQRRQEGDGPRMAIDIPALRKATGLSEEDLPDDATEAQINEALAAKSSEAETEVEEDDEDEEEPEASVEKDNEEQPAEVTASSGVTVDRTQWEETRSFVAKAKKREREDFVAAAVKDGKIPPARKAHYLSLMERDEKGTREFIDKLEADAVPVEERGHSEGEQVVDPALSSQGTGLFPELDARRAKAAEGAAA